MALHVNCASFPIFAGMTLCAQPPLPGVRQLYLGFIIWLWHLLSQESLLVRWASLFSVGMMASIPYVKANSDMPVDFRLVVL